MRVTTAEFIKGYGTLVDKVLTEPVTITKNGRHMTMNLLRGLSACLGMPDCCGFG